MPIEITCKCGSAYRLDDSRAGESFACKICGAAMVLPGSGASRVIAGLRSGPAAQPAAAPTSAATAVADPPQAPSPTAQPEPQVPAPPTDDSSDEPDAMGEPLVAIPLVELPSPPAPPAPPIKPALPAALPPVAVAVKATPSANPIPPKRHPPRGWWFVRAAILILCAGFLFTPWWQLRLDVPNSEIKLEQSISGYNVVRGTLRGLGGEKPAILKQAQAGGSLPAGATRLVLGAMMMAWGPNVYALGLALSLVFAYVAYKCDGRHAIWPYLTCGLGLLLFISGWHLVVSFAPLAESLNTAEEQGAIVGVTSWAYIGLFVLMPLCFIARGRPDYILEDARRWTEEDLANVRVA